MSRRIYKTTIIIYTDEPTMVEGDEWELETLAREATEGGAICTRQECERITHLDNVPDAVTSFFGIDELSDDDDNNEMAMELGMGLGIDAYNDAMGYSTGSPEPCGHHCGHDCPRCGRDYGEEE